MKRLWIVLLAGMLLVAVPILPFLAFHQGLEDQVERVIRDPPAGWIVALIVFGLLSTDIFLPIPSSVVSTLAGGLLPIPAATIASWLGMTAGAIIGFGIARRFGRPFVEHYIISSADLRILAGGEQAALIWLLAVLRGVPVFAEVSVLLAGFRGLAWRQFVPVVASSNLGISLGYAVLGRIAATHQWLPAVLGISAAFPLLLSSVLRSRMRTADN
jgi:uncharacterized membrane protein YdjX (TVP38/TMEM64 family)